MNLSELMNYVKPTIVISRERSRLTFFASAQMRSENNYALFKKRSTSIVVVQTHSFGAGIVRKPKMRRDSFFCSQISGRVSFSSSRRVRS